MPTRVWTSNTTCFKTLCSFWGVGFLGLKFGSRFGLKFGESESGFGSGSEATGKCCFLLFVYLDKSDGQSVGHLPAVGNFKLLPPELLKVVAMMSQRGSKINSTCMFPSFGRRRIR